MYARSYLPSEYHIRLDRAGVATVVTTPQNNRLYSSTKIHTVSGCFPHQAPSVKGLQYRLLVMFVRCGLSLLAKLYGKSSTPGPSCKMFSSLLAYGSTPSLRSTVSMLSARFLAVYVCVSSVQRRVGLHSIVLVCFTRVHPSLGSAMESGMIRQSRVAFTNTIISSLRS